ncbi:unnamed protein product [Schistocephalus solidus]|uniref:RT_RNaseH_2 domain-containing protein n=1 Tax=Schistocephalus solidus TaxID=70667 RepID=A0A183STT8_SCHSO|nr:unnamed protein product [Schistocephalus solidus]
MATRYVDAHLRQLFERLDSYDVTISGANQSTTLFALSKKTQGMTKEAINFLDHINVALAKAPLLAHPQSDAYLTLIIDASLTASRDFVVLTDHKPPVFALSGTPDRYSPREIRHLDIISQIFCEIRQVHGKESLVADPLVPIDMNSLTYQFLRPSGLDACIFYLIQHSIVRRPLQHPYDDRNGKSDTDGIDRVEPAYVVEARLTSPQPSAQPQTMPSSLHTSKNPLPVVNDPVATSKWYPTLTCGSSKLGSSQRPHPGQPSRPVD